MLKSISWSSFLTILFGCAVLYYLILLLITCRPEIKKLLTRNRSIIRSKDKKEEQSSISPEPNVDDFKLTQTVVKDLAVGIQKAVSDGVDRADLVAVLRVKLQKYLHLKGTAYGVAINNSIQRELSQHNIQLDQKELDGLWKG